MIRVKRLKIYFHPFVSRSLKKHPFAPFEFYDNDSRKL
jgi:hypothetical protein